MLSLIINTAFILNIFVRQLIYLSCINIILYT